MSYATGGARRFVRRRLALAVGAAFLLAPLTGNAQSFDPNSPAVLQAYGPPLDQAKIDAARAALNRFLPQVAQFPGLLPQNAFLFSSSGGFEGSAGFEEWFTIKTCCSLPSTLYLAGSDADLNILGNPVTLSDALLRATASFSTPRNFVIGPQPAAIDTGAFELSITGSLSANAQLEKLGAGILALTGNNTWSVAPLISAGTLRGPAASLQTPITSAGTVEFAQASDDTYAHVLQGSGGLTKTGSGTLTLGADNLYTGATRIDEGRLRLQGAGSLGRGSDLAIASNAVLDLTAISGSRFVGALSGSGSILLGDTLLQTVSAADTTFAGVISGQGGILKDGTGRLTLTNANTFSGGTTIAQGTLALVGAGRIDATNRLGMNAGATFDMSLADGARSITSLEGAGRVVLGSNALTIGGDNRSTTFAGTFAGSGDLIKTGHGTLTLTGSTEHTGTLTISQGTLLARTQSLGPAVANHATLVIAEQRSGTGTLPVPAGTLHTSYPELYVYSGNISGTGHLIKRGDGAVWLRGDNTYTGGTHVEDGILVGNHRSLQGNIRNDAGLAFYQTGDGTYAGTTSGAGILIKYGPGNLTLAGINTHAAGVAFSGPLTISDDRSLGAPSGNVIIAGGTLRTGASITSVRNFGLAPEGAIFDTGGNELTITGTISGAGSLGKIGAGTLTLAGQHTYTGPTSVSAGTLRLRGALTSPVSVAAGATLAGSGTIAGKLDLASGATLRIAAHADGNADRIVASQARIEGAALSVEAQPGTYAPQTRYTILSTNSGLDGRFAGAATNLAFLRPTLDYDTHNAYLVLQRTDVQYQAVASTAPQLSVARAVENFAGSDAIQVTTALDGLSAEAARSAFNSIGGIGRAQVAPVQQAVQRSLVRQTAARLGLAEAGGSATPSLAGSDVKLAFEEGLRSDAQPVYAAALRAAGIDRSDDHLQRGFWIRGYGGDGRIDGAHGASEVDFDFAGLIAGYDQAVSEHWRLGALAAYSKPKTDQAAPAFSADMESWHFGAYGRYRAGPLRIDMLATYATNETDSARGVVVGPLARTAVASYRSKGQSLHAEVGYTVAGRVDIEPFVALSWFRQKDDGYAETGAGALAMTVASHTTYSLRSSLGARIAHAFNFAGTRGSIEARAAWSHEFRDQAALSARLAGDVGGSVLPMPVSDVARNTGIVGLGISIDSSRSLRLYADVSSEFGSGLRSHAIGAGLRYQW